ncbi:response regulator transcription factor [Alicyclobacillus fodiniaquatilis]|uniref:Response regulator transcription factor n=1 Tax=Alicyclobacillus fodiniaquatilis TaxID=1661150 RepID=A0ABW4JL80_9BACL
MKETILVVEDEENIQDVCRRYLEREGYTVLMAADGEQGWEIFQKESPHLVVVDVMMPKKDGYELCQDIRKQSDAPIIMLTARGDERDRLMGLTLGADDYLTKPFSPRELMLRIQNILRRLSPSPAAQTPVTEDVLAFPKLTIDVGGRRVTVNGEIVNLTVKEFDALLVMARRPGQVFSKRQLLDLVWGYEDSIDTNVVTVLMRRLREKIEQNPANPRWIHTVWGIGYRFEPGGKTV